MNYILFILISFLCIPLQMLGMFTSFEKPTYWQQKPRYDRNNLTSYELTYTHAWAKTSFGNCGQKSPLLTYSNPEPLLPSFVDCKVKCKDNKPICYALFDGKYSLDTIHNEMSQNIYKNLYFTIHIPISFSKLSNIKITPCDKEGSRIPRTDEISSYLEKLGEKLFEIPDNPVQDSYLIGPLFFFFGYTKSFNHFTRLDLLDIAFDTGLISPLIILEHPKDPIFPKIEPFNFAIPFRFKLLVGLYDWLNIGVTTTLLTYIKNEVMVRLNQYPYPNKLIVPHRTMSTVQHYPQINFNAYIEGEYFLPHWTWYIGFAFTKQYKTTWDICSGTPCQNKIAEDYPVTIPWQQGALILSSEFDFSKEDKKCLPRCKIMYVKRLFGKNCFNSSVLVGQFGFELVYDF